MVETGGDADDETVRVGAHASAGARGRGGKTTSRRPVVGTTLVVTRRAQERCIVDHPFYSD